MVLSGLLKFAWLNRLNASARKSIFWVSAKWPNFKGNDLLIEKSKVARPGPRRMSRPESPNVPGALNANAAVLNHSASWAAFVRPPARLGLPTRSARSAPIPL